jgi:hypothetical protein
LTGSEPKTGLSRKHNSAHALARAKENVDKYFAVVGILEDLGMTLTVLEKKVPSYFAGALELHFSNSGAKKVTGSSEFSRMIDQKPINQSINQPTTN